MLRRLRIENFKSCREIELPLGPLNFFIGANASGKSNALDALKVLQRIATGASVDQALNGGGKLANGGELAPIRGGLAHALFSAANGEKLSSSRVIRLEVDFVARDKAAFSYVFGFDDKGLSHSERLAIDERELFFTNGQNQSSFRMNDKVQVHSIAPPDVGSRMLFSARHGLWGERSKSAPEEFSRFLQDFEPRLTAWIAEFGNYQILAPVPDRLRRYGRPETPGRTFELEEDGEGFPNVVSALLRDRQTRAAYVSWLKELRPAELDDVGVRCGALNEPMFLIREGQRDFLAPTLSDGTLRFAAITSAFFQSRLPSVLAIEEIENGIHASRLRLLVELLRSQTAEGKTQVIATTHSALLLAWLKPEEWAHTFVFKRDPESGETHVTPLTAIPGFAKVIQKTALPDLLAEGWLENAL